MKWESDYLDHQRCRRRKQERWVGSHGAIGDKASDERGAMWNDHPHAYISIFSEIQSIEMQLYFHVHRSRRTLTLSKALPGTNQSSEFLTPGWPLR